MTRLNRNLYGFGIVIVLLAASGILVSCSSNTKDTNEYESIYEPTTDTSSVYDVDTTESTYGMYDGGTDESSMASAQEESEWADNRLSTGSQPYSNEASLKGSSSIIRVETSSSSSFDLVVILKQDGYIVRNKYIRAGDTAELKIPDGYYQVFFYSGLGWNPNKVMSNGMQGGFEQYESFTKDGLVGLDGEILTYQLILQPNGNFQEQPSDEDEVFN